MDNETILRIIEALLLAGAGILTALNNRKQPELDSKRVDTERQKAENENYSSQFSASKTLVESTHELIEISNQLITTVEAQKEQIQKDFLEMKDRYNELQLESRDLKESIEALRKENHKIMSISNKLLSGIHILVAQLRSKDLEPLWQPPQEVLDTMDRRVKRKDLDKG